MTHSPDLRFRTLHVVRIRGRASTDSVAEAIGAAAGDVATMLQFAAEAGHVVHRDGRAAGWSLTPDGRTVHAELIEADRQSCSSIADVRAAYEQFLAINDELKSVCTHWQLAPDGSLNDHTDAAHDERVIDTLGKVDGHVQPICARLTLVLSRYSTYGPRFAQALERVRRGDTAWFTSPAVDSYHTIWFELHEDLLQTLGIERSE